ncbi:MAG: hypothetical protein HY820_27805 [Acidobacteria bacterium]|nr:hypothetical protein [Acidobacteriota bacterium]
MPNAYLISSEYRGGPSPGNDPSMSINENTSLLQGVGALVTALNRNHCNPGTVDTLYIVADNKKGHINVGTGLTVSNAKVLAPLAAFLVPGRDRVGAQLSGFKINSDVGNRDLAKAIAVTLQVSVLADGETFHPKK